MDDAMILSCGHSFGSGGMQHIMRMVSSVKTHYYNITYLSLNKCLMFCASLAFCFSLSYTYLVCMIIAKWLMVLFMRSHYYNMSHYSP